MTKLNQKILQLIQESNGHLNATEVFLLAREKGIDVSLSSTYRILNSLYEKGYAPVWFHGKRIDNPNTHGTGCTLSSAIASNLAKGRDLKTSVEKAKAYISGALAAMLDLGKGSGPMNHAFAIKGEYEIQ